MRYIAFRIIAPLVLFDVKAFKVTKEHFKENKIVTENTGEHSSGTNSAHEKDDINEIGCDGTKIDKHYNEWQIMAMICDKLFFVLLVFSAMLGVIYGYAKLVSQ